MILQRSLPILSFCKFTPFSSPKFLLLSFSYPSPASCSPLTSRFHHRSHRRIRAFATAVSANEKESDTFFADETVSWSSLGVADRLSRALSNISLDRPSLVQAASIPPILAGNDVVVAAETGSGKTHGYLVPLFHKLLCTPTNDSIDTIDDDKVNRRHEISLVLCPNVMLCEQVVRMANCICNDNGEPLLRVAAVCGRQGWPVNKPNIIVSTPAALLNYLHAIDPERRRRSEFFRDVKHVVFDEADMLLCGSFQNQVIRLINLFRFDEKLLSRSKNFPAEKPLDMGTESSMLFELENMEANSMLEEDVECENRTEIRNYLDETEPVIRKKRDWKRTREIYERSKQYIFVAATLPENGKRTAGGELKRLFPDATWISGLYLHRHNPRLEQKWIEVTVDTQVDVLIDAINDKLNSNSSSSDAGLSRTMVFANTVEAVEAITEVLQRSGIECYCYHSESSLEERTRILIDFQQKGGIFVCTDAAARGTDIPNVSHVIQAEFATSAVDFLHRVGRTARAGQPGLVTSMYNESNRDLVAAVRQAGDLCQPVEKAFSRKRSFRKKLKKQGRIGGKASNVQDRIAA